MTPQAIVFDLDGTLIHSAPDLHAAMNSALRSIGREVLDLATVISFIGNGVEKLVQRSLKATGGSDPAVFEDTLVRFLAAYERDMLTLTRPYPGVMTCLCQLSDAGVPMGVCTNKPQSPARDICDGMGLSPFLKAVQGATPTLPKKPDPAPLMSVIDALGVVSERTLYVGDSRIDHETARAAGVPFRLFSGGYLKAPIPELAPAQCFDTWSDVDFKL